MDKIKGVENISIALDFRVITIFMPVVCYTWHKISVSKCKRTRHKEQKESKKRIKHKQIKVIMMQSCMFPKWSAFSSFSHIRTHTHTHIGKKKAHDSKSESKHDEENTEWRERACISYIVIWLCDSCTKCCCRSDFLFSFFLPNLYDCEEKMRAAIKLRCSKHQQPREHTHTHTVYIIIYWYEL